MAEVAYNEANRLFVDEEYDSALENYNKAISLNSNNADYYLKRSACHLKLKNFTDALSDANDAIKLEPSNAQCYLRKGVACFSLEEYETAKTAFEKGFSIDPSNASFKTWLRKCEAELQGSNPASSKTAQPTPVPSPAPATATAPTASQPPAAAPVPIDPTKVRHEWFQTISHVVVTVFLKNTKKEQVSVRFEDKGLDINVTLNGSSNYVFDVDLCDEIVPAESSFEILSTKIEVKMKKKVAARWATLESTDAPIKITKWDEVAKEDKPTYPSSAKNRKDWDKLAREVAEEKPEGEEALNKVFKDIYGGGNEDQRRAMMKSFYESGGTVLSTNWDEVGKGKVEGSAPKGMEMHNWDEVYEK